MTDSDLLRRAAERAQGWRFYLASSLLPYARAERLDDARLAERLGCDLASLPALLLCRQPTREAAVFRADVEAIAERFGLNAVRLASILRRADTLVAFGRNAPDQQGGRLLAAARDREDGDQPPAHTSAEVPTPTSPPHEPEP
jgi:hypothetical protein